MDILKEDGFTIFETLIGMVLLGLLAVFTISVYMNLFSNPRAMLRSDAQLLADNEISRTIDYRLFNDTSYVNAQNNLKVIRSIKSNSNTYSVRVSVRFSQNEKEILSLSAIVKK